MIEPIAKVQVVWRPPAEGGRASLPLGPVHAGTARFSEDSNWFSYVIYFDSPPPSDGAAHECRLVLLCPDRLPEIVRRMTPGSHLLLAEGPRVVADCDLLQVRQVELPPVGKLTPLAIKSAMETTWPMN